MQRPRKRPPLEWLLLGFAFTLPLTIAIAEPLWLLAVLAGLVAARRPHWTAILRSPLFVPVLVYIAWALLSLSWSEHPAEAWGRAHRLLFPFGIFVIVAVYRAGSPSEGRLHHLLLAFAAGACVLAVYDIVRVPVQVLRGTALFDTANMRDPQFYMVAATLLLGLVGPAVKARRGGAWAGALVLSLVGLVLHFKRGVWLSTAAAITLLCAVTRRWRLLLLLGLAAAVLLLLPPVRERLVQVREEFNVGQGGRTALWTRVGPALFAEHPWGMGWGSVTADDLQGHGVYVQPHLDHLHNNLLQIRLETGWPGLAAWIVWMAVIVLLAGRAAARAGTEGRPGVEQAFAAGILCGFLGLMMNGMVEYNFGDSEIQMLICFLAGCAAALPSDAGRAGPEGDG